MKRVLKSRALWFILFAVFTVFLNASGKDSYNIILGISNLPLIAIMSNHTLMSILNKAVPITNVKSKMYIWYGAQIASYAVYGFIFDTFRRIGKRIWQKSKNLECDYRKIT